MSESRDSKIIRRTVLDFFSKIQMRDVHTVEPRFNVVPRDWGNLFVISRVRYIENLDITNSRKKGIVNQFLTILRCTTNPAFLDIDDF